MRVFMHPTMHGRYSTVFSVFIYKSAPINGTYGDSGNSTNATAAPFSSSLSVGLDDGYDYQDQSAATGFGAGGSGVYLVGNNSSGTTMDAGVGVEDRSKNAPIEMIFQVR